MSGYDTEVSKPGLRNPSIEAGGDADTAGIASTYTLTIDGPITETSDLKAITMVGGVGLVVAGCTGGGLNGDGLFQDFVHSDGNVTNENARDLGLSGDSIGGGAGSDTGISDGAGFAGSQGTTSGSGVAACIDFSPAAVLTKVVRGIVSEDSIDVTDLFFASITSASLNITAELLTIDDGAGRSGSMLNLTFSAAFTPAEFASVSDGACGKEIAVCYLRGTRILTPIGPAKVESLKIGDRVIARFGGIQDIKWIDRLSYESAAAAAHKIPIPIRIRSTVPGEGVQAQGLYSSPGHSMPLGDKPVLDIVPINGVTISKEMPVDLAQIELFKIELASRDWVLFECAWL